MGIALSADRTLGGLCDWIKAEVPRPVDLAIDGATTLKAAVIPIVLRGAAWRLPSVSIIVAPSFWGWVWGLAGALLAVPLTIAFIIACQHFRRMQWIPALLLRDKPDEMREAKEEV